MDPGQFPVPDHVSANDLVIVHPLRISVAFPVHGRKRSNIYGLSQLQDGLIRARRADCEEPRV